jgi:hypothetical protein
MTANALPLKVPYADLSKLPRISAAEQRAIRDRMRVEYSFSPLARASEAKAEHQPANSPNREAAPVPTARDRPRPAATRRDTTRPTPPDGPETGSTW